jgi:3-isopropylmalate/(R)-2-methylmalate dehydratase small subunit
VIKEVRGRARILPDGVNTDYIISSSRKKESIDPNALKRWLLEGIATDFAASVLPGDILVAGDAFGGGSAMEVAVTVVKAAGIRAVVAQSFARSYYRNAINNGLMPVECDTSGINENDDLVVRFDVYGVTVTNETAGTKVTARNIPPFVIKILDAGGLLPYLERYGRFVEDTR